MKLRHSILFLLVATLLAGLALAQPDPQSEELVATVATATAPALAEEADGCNTTAAGEPIRILNALTGFDAFSHGTCSGDACGCWDSSCFEACAGNRDCIRQCKIEQKQCAIACCS